jgi:hypothetical protein
MTFENGDNELLLMYGAASNPAPVVSRIELVEMDDGEYGLIIHYSPACPTAGYQMFVGPLAQRYAERYAMTKVTHVIGKAGMMERLQKNVPVFTRLPHVLTAKRKRS